MAIRKEPADFGQSLIEAFLTNERINQILLDLIPPTIWRTSPPCSKRRNIATSFAHIHNVRRMGLRMRGIETDLPKLDRAEVEIADVRNALSESAAAMVELIRLSMENGGRVKNFPPGIVGLVCAAIHHEAHHRGLICHWARELGSPVTQEQQLQLWEWDKVWKNVSIR